MVISTIFKNNLTIICTKKSYTYYLYWVYENDNSYKLFTEQLYARYLPFFQTQPLCSPVYQESIQIITIGLLGTNDCIGLLGTQYNYDIQYIKTLISLSCLLGTTSRFRFPVVAEIPLLSWYTQYIIFVWDFLVHLIFKDVNHIKLLTLYMITTTQLNPICPLPPYLPLLRART